MLQRGLCSATVRLKTPWNDAWQQLWLVWVWIPKNLFDGKQMKGCYKCLQHWKSRDDLCQNWGAGKTKEKNGLELLSSPICGDRWHCTTVKISIRYPNSQLSLFSLFYLANISASMFHVIAIPAPFFLYKHYFFN